jgi:hypothetical protein
MEPPRPGRDDPWARTTRVHEDGGPAAEGDAMLTINIYRWRQDVHSVEDTKRIMETFGERGSGPDEVAHYVFADGTGGMVISDGEDVGWAYRNALDFVEFLDMDRSTTQIALTLEDALPQVIDRMG